MEILNEKPTFLCRTCQGEKDIVFLIGIDEEGHKLFELKPCPSCDGLGYLFNQHKDNLD